MRGGLRASPGALALVLLSLLVSPSLTQAEIAPPVPSAPRHPFQHGVSLGLFSEDPLFSYRDLLREIAALGADHVELVVAVYQENAGSTDLYQHPRFSAPDPTLVAALRDARALGLKALVFPIVRLAHPRSDKEWRGTLAPGDIDSAERSAAPFIDAWWRSYSAVILRLARLAASEGATVFSVGSELSTLDTDHPRWAALVEQVRKIYPGLLTYSGNWDHYDHVGIYDLVDLAGVCGYFSLAGALDFPPYPVDKLVASWRRLRGDLEKFSKAVGKPLLFTELGYLSQHGAAAWPWQEGATKPVDLEDQRRAYQAFVDVWSTPGTDAVLTGVYFWNWYGWGGPTSPGYTPRNKPAADEIKRYFQYFRPSHDLPSADRRP